MIRTIRTLVILAVCVAVVPAYAQQEKKEVHKIIVKDGKVLRSENGGPWVADGTTRGGYIGVQLTEMTGALRDYFRAPKEMGVLVSDVSEGSPAAKAGLRAGDVVTQVDGKKVDSSRDLRSAIRQKKANDQVRVDFVRNGAPQHVFVAVEEREIPMFDLRHLPQHIEIPDIDIDIPAIPPIEIDEEALGRVERHLNSPEFKARLRHLENINCEQIEAKMKEIELRMKELEKKLQK